MKYIMTEDQMAIWAVGPPQGLRLALEHRSLLKSAQPREFDVK